MIEFFTLAFQHPLMSSFMILCLLGFVKMTYDFVLKLFGRYDSRPMAFQQPSDDGIVDEPMDDSYVPTNDPPPDDLMDSEGIPEDENPEYVYSNTSNPMWPDWKDMNSDNNDKESEEQ